MKNLIRLLAIAVACACTSNAHADPRIVGYYAGWAKNYPPSSVPAEKLTHINYAFGIIENGECVVKTRDADEQFRGLIALKKRNLNLQILLSVGGWTDSSRFSDTALTDESRKKFAQSCVKFMLQHELDGIDIDWEFPAAPGADKKSYRKEDTQNFTALLTELRAQLDARGKNDGRQYLLTIAAPASRGHWSKIELQKIHPLLDAINLMTYDYAGFWSKRTSFNSPLFTVDENAGSIDLAVHDYLGQGVPSDKLVVGVPFYARAWEGVKDVNHGLDQSHDGKWPEAIASGKEWTYRDIVENYLGKGPQRFWDDKAQVPWLYDAKKQLMVSYDDPKSIELKARYVREHHLAGMMIWELSEDDARSSLLTAISETLRHMAP